MSAKIKSAVQLYPAEESRSLVMAQNWPIVRRETEYATIHSALVDGTGICGIVLVGEPGVGKTTLARLVTQSLPFPVRWVAGTESARSIPLVCSPTWPARRGSRPCRGLGCRTRNHSRRRQFGDRG